MIYIYKLPETLSNGFCGTQGHPITMTNVDWFNSPSEVPHIEKISVDEFKKFIAGKVYARNSSRLMALDTEDHYTMLIKFTPCLLCNNAGMEYLDICQACGRIERVNPRF